jgi:hypothetical protein
MPPAPLDNLVPFAPSLPQSTIKPLLRPHLEDMEKKIAPGFSLLTWTSMNVDGYLHRFKQVSGWGSIFKIVEEH